MAQDDTNLSGGNQPPSNDPRNPDYGSFTLPYQHNTASARIPESVARGAFATGLIVMFTSTEFVLDFVARMNRPQSVSARVVVSPLVLGQMIQALKQNLENYRQRFGPLPPMPVPVKPPQPPSIQELYEDLKLSDDLLSGNYANAVMILHSPAEFCLDFITSFYPRSAVSSRVYVSAGHIQGIYDSLQASFNQYRARLRLAHPGNIPPASQGDNSTDKPGQIPGHNPDQNPENNPGSDPGANPTG